MCDDDDYDHIKLVFLKISIYKENTTYVIEICSFNVIKSDKLLYFIYLVFTNFKQQHQS